MRKYFIFTYGCQMNESDSERIAGYLKKIGYQSADSEKQADLIVLNMCAVRQSAVERAYGKINNLNKLKKQNKKIKIIATGCILPFDKKRLKQLVDYVIPIKNLLDWQKILKNKEIKNVSHIGYFKILPQQSSKISAFIPISFGCNNLCFYCAVPYTRGKLICRSSQDILKEVKLNIKKGIKEIWLLGQNVNDYKFGNVDFGKLLKTINDISGNFWIRFTSPHPSNFSDKLIETIAKCPKITPYFNLPLQSGDNEILKKMNRGYTAQKYGLLIKKIRSAFKKYREGTEKDPTISTDIIVGYPGETKKQFKNTADLFKRIKFEMAYISKYSPRKGTFAEKNLKDNVKAKEKEKRWETVNEI